MNIGEKIRSLRVAKLMSQSELAGNQITRNMLSCIENGKAQPSLSTVSYIAERLNVPVGLLLAEQGDEILYRKMAGMSNIKRAYKAGDLAGCRSLCLLLRPEQDDEILLLLAECDLGIAKEAFRSGKLRYACRMFDEALRYAGETLYPAPHIKAEVRDYFRLMGKISATLYSDVLDDGSQTEMISNTAFSVYVNVLEDPDVGVPGRAESYGERFPEERFYAAHLRIRAQMKRSEYGDAKNALLGLLHSEILLNETELYAVLLDLEICCRETEDYKGAYQYANEKVQLLEQLLKDE